MRKSSYILSALFLAMTLLVNAQDAGRRFEGNAFDQVRSVEIYPNPATEYITVQVDNSSLYDVNIELRSMIGNVMSIQVEKIGNNRYRIPLKDFASGYYFVVVQDDFSRFRKAYKFLKR
jgi:hypothetical protein